LVVLPLPEWLKGSCRRGKWKMGDEQVAQGELSLLATWQSQPHALPHCHAPPRREDAKREGG